MVESYRGEFRMLYIIIQRPAGSVTTTYSLQFTTGKIVNPVFTSAYYLFDSEEGPGLQQANAALVLNVYKEVYVLRQTVALNYPADNKCVFVIDANFNYDDLRIISNDFNRVEFRNENGVLITDNGMPWNDGTYPPDAKNRAGLTGLHAAPIASTNEFADLSGLDPNKEVELTGAERGAGIEYALERDEDNGL